MKLKEKTFKREYAFALIAMLLYQVFQGEHEMVEAIIWPFLSFVATSAGLHIYDKTTSNRREVLEVVE